MPLTPTTLNLTVSPSPQPPHFSSLIGKSLSLDKAHNVLIEEVLAEGGFGVIFLVKNSGDKVKYAMKRVVVNNERDYEGVVGEVGVMTSLSPKTPHILPSLSHLIVSYPQTSTFELCNLMPLCSRNLFQIASTRMQKQSGFNNDEILQIFQSVASGLQYLHNSTPPILHRDVKIENILVMGGDELKSTYVLSDFGSATTRVWDPSVDSIQVINEDLDKHTTPLYRSPEMVDLYGCRGPIGVASDVWALGVAGYKLMTFKDPFESILAIQNRNLSWGSSTVKSKFSEHVVSLVECCLAENQSFRPRVEEVLGICSGGIGGDWAALNSCVQRISTAIENLKREEEESRAKVNNAPVVMETTVTPRQRPKRGGGGSAGGGGGSASGIVVVDGVIPVLAAPPKSPKPVSPCNNSSGGGFFGQTTPTSSSTTSQSTTPNNLLQQTQPQSTISPSSSSSLPVVVPSSSAGNTPSPTPTLTTTTTQQQQPLPTHSWNPFDEDFVVVPPPPSSSHPQYCDNDSSLQREDLAGGVGGVPTSAAAATDDDDDDPFAKAPFGNIPVPAATAAVVVVKSQQHRGSSGSGSSSHNNNNNNNNKNNNNRKKSHDDGVGGGKSNNSKKVVPPPQPDPDAATTAKTTTPTTTAAATTTTDNNSSDSDKK